MANDLKPLVRDIAGCEITISDSSMMASMTGGNDIQVNISGSDYDVLTQIATDLTEQIAALEDATEVSNSLENTIPAVSRIGQSFGRSPVWFDHGHHWRGGEKRADRFYGHHRNPGRR